jgi:hypothetical protein
MSAIREDELMYKTILVHVDQSPPMDGALGSRP